MNPENSQEIFDRVRELDKNVRVPKYMLDLVDYILDNMGDLIKKLGLKRPLITYSNKGTHWAAYSPGTWNQPVITIIVKQHLRCDCKDG